MRKKRIGILTLLLMVITLGACSNANNRASGSSSKSSTVPVESSTSVIPSETSVVPSSTSRSTSTATSQVTPSTSTSVAPSTSSASESSSTASSTSTSQKEKYLSYTLKDGANKTILYGSPWLDLSRNGVIKQIEKPNVKNDFYGYANYDIIDGLTVSETTPVVGGMMGSINQVTANLKRIMTETTTSNYSASTKKLYSNFMSTDKVADIAYVKGMIDEVKAITSLDDLYNYVTSTKAFGILSPLFGILKDESLLLYEPQYNFDITNIYYGNSKVEAKDAVFNSVKTSLTKFGVEESEATTIAQKAIEVESTLHASISYTPMSTTVGNIDTVYTKLKPKRLFKYLGYDDDYPIMGVSNIDDVIKKFENLSFDDAKAFIEYRIAYSSKIVLSQEDYAEITDPLIAPLEIRDKRMQFYGEQYIQYLLTELYTNVIDRCYVDNFVPATLKTSLTETINLIKEEYKNVIDSKDWLSAETKTKAKEKLEAIKCGVLYPDFLPNILEFDCTNKNTTAECIAAYKIWAANANQPNNSTEQVWMGSITLPNAQYMQSNSLCIYSGMIAGSNYKATTTKEELYGGIGVIIGHEISHAFDSQGAEYDKYGAPNNWWTDNDKQAFAMKVQKVITAYNQLKYTEQLACPGEKVVNEVIADMGGMAVMLKLAKKDNNFNYQKFFESYANNYACLFNDRMYDGNMLYNDSHALTTIRVNYIVNQFQEFLDTYDIKDGDVMYVAPNDRLIIW